MRIIVTALLLAVSGIALEAAAQSTSAAVSEFVNQVNGTWVLTERINRFALAVFPCGERFGSLVDFDDFGVRFFELPVVDQITVRIPQVFDRHPHPICRIQLLEF